jgi:hypothetical protein
MDYSSLIFDSAYDKKGGRDASPPPLPDLLLIFIDGLQVETQYLIPGQPLIFHVFLIFIKEGFDRLFPSQIFIR